MGKKRDTVKVDFTGVSSEGGGRLLDEGKYTFEVKEAELTEAESSGKDMIALTLEVVEDADGNDDFAGTKAWDNLSLQPQALWKLRQFMEAAGLETEDGEMDIDPSEFEGLVVVANIIHEEYRGRTKHRIDGYEAAEDSNVGKSSSSGKKKPKKDEEDDAPTWKINQAVKFKDGKKWLEGKVKAIDDSGDEPMVTVKVGKDEYEMGPNDLEAA